MTSCYGNNVHITGVGITKTISSVPLFSEFFSIIKTRVSCWILRLYLAGVAAVPSEFPAQRPVKRGALMFSLICAWINGWVNNGEAGDFRRHRVHCDVIVVVVGSNRLCIKQSSTKDITSYIIWTSADYNVDHLQPLPNINHAQNITCIMGSL